MTDEQESGAKRSNGLFEWFGALVVSVVLGLALVTGWLWLLHQASEVLAAIGPEPVDVETLPVRSLKVGFWIGLIILFERVSSILRKDEGQWPATAVLTLALMVAAPIASAFSDFVGLQLYIATLMVGLFSAIHLMGAVVVRIWPALVNSSIPGMATALSFSALLPVCGGAAAADHVAALSEPTQTIDSEDVVAGLQKVWRDQCFEDVEELREKGIRIAQAKRSLSRQDAEDVVGVVMLKVCTQDGPVIDLEPYFISAVLNRSVDSVRRRAKRDEKHFRWGQEPRLLSLTPEAIVGNSEGCLMRTLATLNEEERTVVEWTVIEGRTLDEVASVLGRSRSALDRSKQRALERLRKACADK